MQILFVCSGNTCRSPMAEAYLKDLFLKAGIQDVHVSSAGTHAGYGEMASFESVEVMKKYGIDLSGHRSSPLTQRLVESSDLIITMTDSHRLHVGAISSKAMKKTKNLLEFAGNDGNISDPIGGTEEKYDDCFSHMKNAIDNLFLNIIKDKSPEEGK